MTLERIYEKATEVAAKYRFPWPYEIEVTVCVGTKGIHYQCYLVSDKLGCLDAWITDSVATPAELLAEFETMIDTNLSML